MRQQLSSETDKVIISDNLSQMVVVSSVLLFAIPSINSNSTGLSPVHLHSHQPLEASSYMLGVSLRPFSQCLNASFPFFHECYGKCACALSWHVTCKWAISNQLSEEGGFRAEVDAKLALALMRTCTYVCTEKLTSVASQVPKLCPPMNCVSAVGIYIPCGGGNAITRDIFDFSYLVYLKAFSRGDFPDSAYHYNNYYYITTIIIIADAILLSLDCSYKIFSNLIGQERGFYYQYIPRSVNSIVTASYSHNIVTMLVK